MGEGPSQSISMQTLPVHGSNSSLSLGFGSTSTGLNVNGAPDGPATFVQMLNKLQCRKKKYERVTMSGIFALGVVAILAGLSAMTVEVITKLKYPNASAALLSIEVIGISVGVSATLEGILSITSWRLSQCGHKGCLTGMLKSFCSVILLGAFIAFCLSLIAFGIYTTLRDWQRQVSPFLGFLSKMVKHIGREDLEFPTGFLEELVVLKAAAFGCHLIILVTTGGTSFFCILNSYVSSMPDFGGLAGALSALK